MGHFAKRINFRAVFFDDLPVDSQEIKVRNNSSADEETVIFFAGCKKYG